MSQRLAAFSRTPPFPAEPIADHQIGRRPFMVRFSLCESA
jgi:hypothetical protein